MHAQTNKSSPEAIVQQEQLTQKNKTLILNAYQELFGDHDVSALDRYWAENYIQHNPTMTDGRDAVKGFWNNWASPIGPSKKSISSA